MRAIAAAVVAVLLPTATCALDGQEPQRSAVTPLNPQNYEKYLGSTPISLVLFHDPGNITAEAEIIQEFDFAAILLQQMVAVTSVDVAAQPELAGLFNISSTPAIRLIWAGGPVKVFEGDASAKSVVNVALAEWVMLQKWQNEELSKTLPVKRLDNAIEAAKVLGSGHLSLVGYFSNVSSSEYSVFQHVASLYRDHKVNLLLGEVIDLELLAKLKIKDVPALSLYNPEVGLKWYPGANFSVEEILPWVESGRQQVFNQLNGESVASVNNQYSAIFFLNLTDDQSTGHILGLRESVLQMAANITFFYADWDKMHGLAHRMGVSAKGKPKLVIWDPIEGQHFNFLASKQLTSKTVSKFCSDFLENKLTPSFKSAPRPEGNDGPVVEIVTDTFREIVGEPNSDVVVYIYSGGSVQSRLLFHVFTEVAQSLSYVDGLVFAQMDQDDNDLLPGIPKQVPGIFFFPAGKKDQVQSYNGMVTLNGLLDFVETHATVALPDHAS